MTTATKRASLRVEVSPRSGSVSVRVLLPPKACALWVLGHGAGAGMDHPLMTDLAEAMAGHGIASWRFQFPYSEAGRKRPDPAPVLQSCVRANVVAAQAAYPQLPLFAGGKSMGGRMAVQAHVDDALAQVRGFIFAGYPLVAAQGGALRDAPLRACSLPMLLLQGTRDKLAPLPLLKPLCADLGKLATLHVVNTGDHSLIPTKASGKTPAQVLDEAAKITATWINTLLLSQAL